MGGAAAKLDVTKYTRCTVAIVNSGIVEFDKITLLLNEVVDNCETLRYNVVNARECLFRITKTHLYQGADVTDTFKVWTWAVGACNEGSLANVQFKADWEDYDISRGNAIFIQKVEQQKITADFSAIINQGKQAFQIVNNDKGGKNINDQRSINSVDGPKITFAQFGQCADFRLQVYPKILANYIYYVKLARDYLPALQERMNFLIAKVIALKENKDEFIRLLKDLPKLDQVKIVVIIAANIIQYKQAQRVIDAFNKILPDRVIELTSFLQNYASIFATQEHIAKQVFENVGIRPHYIENQHKVLRGKISKVATYLKFNQDELLFEADQLLKKDRKTRRPKAKSDQSFNDIDSEETIFPCRYRWMDNKFFDTHFSAISIDFSELETARLEGQEAKKSMFKATGVGKFKEKSVASAFEVWTWACAGEKGDKFPKLEMKLLDAAPWIGGVEIEKVEFSSDAEHFRKNLIIWLKHYAPSRYSRLQDHWNDIQVRYGKIDANHENFIEITKDLHPADVYNALTSLSKNLLCNKVYLTRSTHLYLGITQVNGKMGENLYSRQDEILAEAESLGKLCKGTEMKEMAEKHVQGRIADQDDREQRKQASKDIKEERKKKKHFWD